MTNPIMYRVLALLVAAILATAGLLLVRSGTSPATSEPALAEAAAVEALEARVNRLDRQITAGEDRAEGLADQVASLRRKLDRQMSDLRASVKDLRGAVREARSGVGAASEKADEASARAERALARAEGIVRDLRVLEDRFDVHLRRHHGGG